MRRRSYKKRTIFTILLIVIAVLVVGYATLSSVLNIFGGLAIVGGNSFNVNWSNIIVNEDSTGIATTPPTISNNDNGNSKQINFVVNLNTPGDFYEFNVDAVNTGTIDAMIGSYDYEILDANDNPVDVEYLNCKVSYSDDTQLSSSQLLRAGETVTYKVRVEFSTDISGTELPSGETALRFGFVVTYVQADDNAYDPIAGGRFGSDSWNDIIQNIRNGNADIYEVGSTKEIDMGSFGTHTVRVANKSTPAECNTPGFSQTACGFVLEFEDIITTHNMNSDNTNEGGWPASSMRTYVNSDIYNALPIELKNGIIDTTVVSGYGNNGSNNFTSIDKLYLLSTHEVWEDIDEITSFGIDYHDTAYHNTRQLDYYSLLNTLSENYQGDVEESRKYLDEEYYHWWLRSASYDVNWAFLTVLRQGSWQLIHSPYELGVSPAFRIG